MSALLKKWRIFKNPLIWLGPYLVFLAVQNNLRDGELSNVVRSDGSGYYAYLPAIFLYNDATYEQSTKVEKTYYSGNYNQAYLFKDQNGNICNKYFPGLGILQAPFFACATATAWMIESPVDGYSQPFQLFFLLGSLFYTLLGLWLFFVCLKRIFPELNSQLPWLVTLLYLATTLVMYNTNTLGFTHHYSFCLFGLFALQVLNIKDRGTSSKSLFALGLLLGLITLLRPTNILVVFIVPFLLGDWPTLKSFLGSLFANRLKGFLICLAGFLGVLFILFAVWKWQSGSWFVWSYKGEGFYFLHPKLLENLFGFRVGLFVHSPVLILAILGGIILFRKLPYQLSFWWIYFLSTTWVISAWWCWDYESTFGNRPFTEHLFFILLPIIYLLKTKPKMTFLLVGLCACLGVLRYQEYISGYMVDQRFTRKNYLKSMAFWVDYNKDRWRYPRSVPPFGEVVASDVLVNQQEETHISANQLYAFTGEKQLVHPRTSERLYYSVQLEKRISKPLESVYLVIDAANADRSKRMYDAIELFNDRFEGMQDWGQATFSGLIPDYFQDFDYVKIYLWNEGHCEFDIRNLTIQLDTYQQE